ncbi:protein DEK isoform X1 [Oncorhynchus mykiss]|uniref:protein DEK isoform X1 n=1 Tax=Oncorhynchus mykiss TaxID=8022 RepID=UPI001877F544|nr:protein DEK isoform X1 [Oncorhynchus mykiss]
MRFLISNLKLATCIILISFAETLVDVVITQQARNDKIVNIRFKSGHGFLQCLVEESGDSSDDEPLVKMIRKPLTDCQLSERVKALLKYTDMADVRMKQIYNRLFEMCPRYDLSNKKDIIKQTVKEEISLLPRVLIKPYS